MTTTDEQTNEPLVRSAMAGDTRALETLIRRVQTPVYSLCLRFLWNAEDAKDACQEILTKIVLRLSSFKFESQLDTWVYRIACNHLIDVKRSQTEALDLHFAAFEADLLSEQLDPDTQTKMSPSYQAELEELRIGCTLALLQCLDREHRLAYILGEILEFGHDEAASVLEIAPANFRKRLQRAREKIETFTRRTCDVINPAAPCHCTRRLGGAKRTGRVSPDNYQFATAGASHDQVLAQIRSLEETRRTAAAYRHQPEFAAPTDFARAIRELIAQLPNAT